MSKQSEREINMKKRLIINADDFGISRPVNAAVIELLDSGCITNATLMPTGIASHEAILWTKESKSKRIGLHFTLTNDPFQEIEKYKMRSLTHQRCLEDDFGFLYKNLSYIQKKVPRSTILREVDAQFKFFKECYLSHLDFHMYCIHPTLTPILFYQISLKCKKRKIPLRFAKKHHLIDNYIYNLSSPFPTKLFSSILRLSNIRIPEYVFIFPYNNEEMKDYEVKRKAYIEFLGNLPMGTSEIHLHPAVETGELKLYNPLFWDQRVTDYQLLKDPMVLEVYQKNNIQLISYQEI